MPLRIYALALLLATATHASAQGGRNDVGATSEKEAGFLVSLLRAHATSFLRNILDKPDSFRYQILYTRIDRDAQNNPHFHEYALRLNRLEYFNPASTVKMPLAFLALEKMERLKKYTIDKFTPMLTDSAYSRQTVVRRDSSSADGLPSLAQYIKKIFLVSDNDAYNRLYEFLGQEAINKRLWQMGYPDIRITRRFVPMNEDENRHSNPIRFAYLRPDPEKNVPDTQVLYAQPPAVSTVDFDFSRKVLLGNAHFDGHDSLIHAPMDFTRHNNVPLEDLTMILRSVLFPSSVPRRQRFNLTPVDRQFLYRWMSEYPSEAKHPHYDTTEYFDGYCKFWMFKSGRTPIPPYIRVFNKPGWSYGFLTDVAYIADFRHNVEFMISGVIYVNSDGVLNDDKYEYDQVGLPFFKEVGNIIYEYELERPREHAPGLSRFRLSYDQDTEGH